MSGFWPYSFRSQVWRTPLMSPGGFFYSPDIFAFVKGLETCVAALPLSPHQKPFHSSHWLWRLPWKMERSLYSTALAYFVVTDELFPLGMASITPVSINGGGRQFHLLPACCHWSWSCKVQTQLTARSPMENITKPTVWLGPVPSHYSFTDGSRHCTEDQACPWEGTESVRESRNVELIRIQCSLCPLRSLSKVCLLGLSFRIWIMEGKALCPPVH